MSKPKTWFVLRLVTVFAALFAASLPAAVAQESAKPKEPTWLHGLEMRVRKAGEDEFTKDTMRVGVEAFKDENTGCLIYITESGSLTVLNPTGELKPTPANEKPKSPVWLHGLNLKARKWNEQDFTKDTRKYGIEAFKDENTGSLIYVTETKSISALNPPGALKTAEKPKEPEWLFALVLLARKAGEADFTKDTRKWGVEAFKDTNTDQLVYISETGSIAAITPPAPVSKPTKIKEAPFINGLDLQVRPAGEVEWTKAKKFGLEYYKEENAGPLLHISQDANLAAVNPTVTVKSELKMKPPKYSHGLELKVRPGGEADFAKAKKFGIEVFKDENTGCWVYICETGEIAVVVAK
jgi:hypothetical protein